MMQMVGLAQVMEGVSSGLVQSMSEISEASQNICDIITTIKQVAFQTNILALNAAVEAARAGDHGKVFAVVAGEVRTLAQSTAEAARHISMLIQDMLGEISKGEEMVHGSESTLSTIFSKIQEVSQTVQEIAVATSEQAQDIDELNKAIRLIDISTQGNASTSEEPASTSQNMSTDAGSLAGHVKRFKVSEMSHPG